MNMPRLLLRLVILLAFAAVPPVMAVLNEPYYVDLGVRIMIFAIAAVSLDLILGFGGMVSFGHAAYLGIGAYAVGILNFYGIYNGFGQFALAIGASGAIAALIGAICLRTSGVYFIMITLAFAQMLFFLGISLEEFGGDDGLPTDRSEFGLGLDLYDSTHFFYFVLAILAAALILSERLIGSRFGRVIRAAKSNRERMQAIGYPIFRYQLTAFTIAGSLCGLAGALLANAAEFASPEYMHWTRSGEIMIMVIVGGMGTLLGPVLGSALFLLLEEYLPEMMEAAIYGAGDHWQILFGPILILVVLFGRGGLYRLWGWLLSFVGVRHG